MTKENSKLLTSVLFAVGVATFFSCVSRSEGDSFALISGIWISAALISGVVVYWIQSAGGE